MSYHSYAPPTATITVELVVLSLREASLHVFLARRWGEPYQSQLALPGGFLAHADEDLEIAASRELAEATGLDAEALLLRQFGTYGAPHRDPRGRVVSVAYLAVKGDSTDVVVGTGAGDASWYDARDVLFGRETLAFDHRQIVADGVQHARLLGTASAA